MLFTAYITLDQPRLGNMFDSAFLYMNLVQLSILLFYQENVWFSLGCAAVVTEKQELAAKAFHWCVSMNPDVG